MKELEITTIPPLAADEQSLVDLHSMLNIFNVLRGELCLIGLTVARVENLLQRSLATCDDMIRGLRQPARALAAAQNLEAHVGVMHGEIDTVLALQPEWRAHPDVAESLAISSR